MRRALQPFRGVCPPWSPTVAARTAAGSAIGVVLIVAACIATSGASEFADQIAWVNVAVIGTVVAGASQASWLLAGRRAVGQRRVKLLPDAVRAGVAHHVDRSGDTRVWVTGTSRSHRSDCLLVVGKTAVAAPDDVPACEVCA